MPERRFTDTEVAAILEQASNAEAPSRAVGDGAEDADGLTLAQLQDIGREVGISPEAIRQAALVVDRGGLATARRFVGFPLGVGRVVYLERGLTDDEWDRFVVDLRETFAARGVVRRDGSLRQWTNGNLQVLLEPSANGYRVRMKTIRQQSLMLMRGGIGFLAAGGATFAAMALRGALHGSALFLALELVTAGAGMFTAGAIRLPSWAGRRRSQMEELAARLVSMVDGPAAPG